MTAQHRYNRVLCAKNNSAVTSVKLNPRSNLSTRQSMRQTSAVNNRSPTAASNVAKFLYVHELL